MSRVLFEACVESVESAVAAETGGADRVELCSSLLEGGLTPSYGMLKAARERVRIGIMAMIRPRGGDFCYSDAEFAAMHHDVELAKRVGADGVVFGILTPAGEIDCARARSLIEQARPLAVTFHRAFDMTVDPFAALDTLVDLGVDRVLTSGQESSALEGLEMLASLVEHAGQGIVVMPGGGITDRNIARLLAKVPFAEMHVGGGSPVESRMRFRNPRVFMGGTLRPAEYLVERLSPEYVVRVIHAARRES
jgi:copper homeostasis protein